MSYPKCRIALLLCLLAFNPPIFSQVKLLKDVESPDDIRRWDQPQGKPVRVSTAHPLLGKASVELYPHTYLALFSYTGLVGDFSGYDALQIDFDNTTGQSQPLSVLVADQAWQDAGATYWDRHNASHILPPGRYTFSLPLTGLYRGEAGSRYNHLKTPIDPAKIIRLDLGIGKPGQASDKPVYMDNFRLVTERVPDGIRAFDFGPTEQNLQPGFKPVAWDTVYSQQTGFGLTRELGEASRSGDDTFPTVLYRDWTLMSEGWQDAEFAVDLPNGLYHVFTVFSDCGYWGGEAIRHTKRHIEAEGKTAWSEDLGPEGNYYKPDHLFEDVEPKVGDDFWNLYMQTLFEPKRFTAAVADGQLNLKWHADAPWSAKVNCVIIYPDAKRAQGDAFCSDIVNKQRKEFTVAAVEHVPASGGNLEDLPATEKSKGYLFFLTDYEDDTYQTTIPAPDRIKRRTTIRAAKGEYEPVSFAVRPLKDLGRAAVTVSDFTSPAATIASDNFDVRVVRHLARRGFGAIDYTIIPQMLIPADKVDLPKDLTREFVITARVPAQAPAGDYAGRIRIRSDKGLDETLDVELVVYPFALDNSEYVFGFFGTIPDLQVARLLRNRGFNSFSGGYPIGLDGFAKDGTPALDFTRMDSYLAMLKSAGFTQEGWGYGGYQVNHVGYTRDDAFFDKYQKETGLTYVQLLKNVFEAVQRHATQKGWLPGVYGLVDETRTVDFAKKQLAQINAINAASDWLKTGGSYSVSYANGDDPDDYMQWLFEALDASSLNNHDESVMKKAAQLGKDIYIYNQGQTRYSFGAYQWSEYTKGVRGRHQWHLHIQHGFQFFDLDGREPDTGVLYYGKGGPIPTLAFLRCAEGADDFYYCQTLHNRIEQCKAKKLDTRPEVGQTQTVLDPIETRIPLNTRQQPDWLDNSKMRTACAQSIIALDTLLATSPKSN